MKIKHIDLFSGIGGAAIAVDEVWGKENVEHIFCEIDPFCEQVLKKHYPNSQIYGDIRTFTNTRSEEQRGLSSCERKEISKVGECRILTGGFPCQPFSQAGRRKGTDDNRHLWPEMFRVIREFRPQWVIGENVAGLLTIEQGMVFKQVCADLESENYEVQCFVIPAVAVNAPHRRDRVWIVGNAKHNGQHGSKDRESSIEGGNDNKAGEDKLRKLKGTDSIRANASNGTSTGLEREKRKKQPRNSGRFTAQSRRKSKSWNQNWLEVATRFCRVDDGVSARLVGLPDGRKISYSKWRQEALKGLGNAWVPQVAIEIMKGIREITPQ